MANASARERADLCEVDCVDAAKVQHAQASLPASATVAAVTEILRALGDQTRFQIVAALATTDELCVCDLAVISTVSQSAVSHSLRTLRQLGLVRFRKVGRIAYYSLTDDHIAGFVLEAIRHVDDA